ncbi:MAG: response regulator, partial [Myxococcota bacterium]
MKPAVLFVDDEPNILKAMGRLFRGENFDLKTAASGAEALKMMDAAPMQVVVSDHRMPGMTGVDLLSKIRERWPDIIRILVTGNSEINIAVDAINRGQIYRLITKPWNDDEIRATVREAVDLYTLRGEIKRLNHLTQEQNLHLKDLHQNLEQKVKERTQDLCKKNAELSLAYIGTLKAIVGTIDAQHRCAANHSERVGMYTAMIARRMGLDESRVRRMQLAGLLHDVGKIGIRGEIFSKPGPLSEAEAAEMKQHPVLSAKILSPVPWLQDLLPMIRHHHEWYDGDS